MKTVLNNPIFSFFYGEETVLLYQLEGESRQDPHVSLAYNSHHDFLNHFCQRLPKESYQISKTLAPDPEIKYENQIDGCFVYCSVKLHY